MLDSRTLRFTPLSGPRVGCVGAKRKRDSKLTMAVDTHIFRVSNRTGIAPGKNVVEVEQKLMKFVPKEYLLDSHHWLILHGRYVCLARKPRCGSCRIEDLCEYKHKTSDD